MWFGVGLAAVGLVFLIVRMPRDDEPIVDVDADVAVDELEPAAV